MISIWVFIVACAVFIYIMYRQYLNNKEMDEGWQNTSDVLEYYVNKYGNLTNDEVARVLFEDKKE